MLDFSQTNDWNFEVEERPVLVEGLGRIEGKKALVRTDTNTLMGVHSENYRKISHDEIVNGQYEAIKEANISHDFDFKVHCVDGGRKLKVEVLFNDLVQEPEPHAPKPPSSKGQGQAADYNNCPLTRRNRWRSHSSAL